MLEEPPEGEQGSPTPQASEYEPTEVATSPDDGMESVALDESMDGVAPELDWLVAGLTIDREQSA